MTNPKVVLKNIEVGKEDIVTGMKMIEYDVSVSDVKPKLIKAHIKILFPKGASIEKSYIKNYIELVNTWVFSKLPGVYYSLTTIFSNSKIAEVLKSKYLGYRVWATVLYEPGKGIKKPLEFTVHLINTRTNKLIWLYTIDDYGAKHSKTNVSIELNKNLVRFKGETRNAIIKLLKCVIDRTSEMMKTFNMILYQNCLKNTKIYEELPKSKETWLKHVLERYKRGGFVWFLFKVIDDTIDAIKNKDLKVKDETVRLGFLPNNYFVISGAEGILRGVSTIIEFTSWFPNLLVGYPVTRSNWIKMFIACSFNPYDEDE